MIEKESLQLGTTTCDYIRQTDFIELCNKWLQDNRLRHIVTLNPEMVMAATTDNEFKEALNKADIRVPDGSGLIWAQWYLRSHFWLLLPSLMSFLFREVERITGVDAVFDLAKLCQDNKLPLYLLGGTTSQVNKTSKLLKNKFPDLEVHTSRDHKFDKSGPEDILNDINDKKPGVLLVAYGAPKQTIWIENNRESLSSVKIAVGVGGAFAILSEEKKRAPQFMRKLNMEWLWRLILEPKRLPRIWTATVKFPIMVKKQKDKEDTLTIPELE